MMSILNNIAPTATSAVASAYISLRQTTGGFRDYQKERHQLIQEFNQKTGSEALSNLLLQLSKKIEAALKKVPDADLQAGLRSIEGYGILDLILLQMVKNGFDELVKNGFDELGEMPADTDPLVALASHLSIIFIDEVMQLESFENPKESLEPIVVKMLTVLLPHAEKSIPFDIRQEQIWNGIKDKMVDFFAEALVSTTSWMLKDRTLPVQMENPQTKQAFTNFSKWVSDFSIEYLHTNYDALGKNLQESVWDSAFPTTGALEKERVCGFFRTLIYNISSTDTRLCQVIGEGLNRHMQAVFEEVFLAIFEKTNELDGRSSESNQREKLACFITDIIKIGVDHFMNLNVAKSELHLPRVDLMKEDEFNLYAGHVGHQRPPSSVEGFFVPLVTDVLEIVNVTKETLPVPPEIKGAVWDLLMGELPKLFDSIYTQVLDSKNLDAMLLNLVNNINAAMYARHDASNSPATPGVATGMQKEMNDAIGEFLQEVINTIPGTWTESILASDRVRIDTQQNLGQMLKNHLEGDWSLSEIVRLITTNGMQSAVANSTKDPNITKRLEESTVNMLVEHTIILFETYILHPWNEFQRHLDNIITGTLGPCGLAVKKYLGNLSAGVLYPVISTVLYVLTYPIRKLVEKLLYWHIHKKVVVGVKMTHLPMHKDLLLNITQKLVDSLKDPQVAAANEE